MSRRGVLEGLVTPGVPAALLAAALFGAGTPFAKTLLSSVSPWLLAGLLYAGSGIALSVVRWLQPVARGSLTQAELGYLLGAIGAGGVIAPVLLMSGLALMPAAGASLLLNVEGVFTALLAWFVFRENFDRRIAFGMVAIAAGAVTLSWTPQAGGRGIGALLVLGACLAWAIDNNLTRKVALLDATWLACIKGLVAGAVNLGLAVISGVAAWPSGPEALGALGIGALAYGASLVLFVIALRRLGTARTAAYFSLAPFVGALVSLVWLREPLTIQLAVAAALMGLGVWLHLTERHEHEHHHEALEHEHEHVHDEHHHHAHDREVPPGTRHTHAHRHAPLTHSHHHFPDTHHRHDH